MTAERAGQSRRERGLADDLEDRAYAGSIRQDVLIVGHRVHVATGFAGVWTRQPIGRRSGRQVAPGAEPSLDGAAAERGRVETKPLRLGGPSLVINADASRGELRVALLEADSRVIGGFTLDSSESLRANATRWVARWRSKATPPTDRPVRVVVEMTNCRLFSLSTGTSK